MATITTAGLQFLYDLCKLANSLNVTGIIIEPNEKRIRGVNDDTSILILDERELSDYFYDFDMLCINRIPHFLNRLSLILQSDSEYTIELTKQKATVLNAGENLDVITSIYLKNSKLNVSYRCAGAGIIKAPKRLKNNREPIVTFTLSEETTQLLQKMTPAMSCGVSTKDQLLKLDYYNSIVKLTCEDSIGDSCSFNIDEHDIIEKDDNENISKKYPFSHILDCIKTIKNPSFKVKTNGFLQTEVGSIHLNILIIPKANLQ